MMPIVFCASLPPWFRLKNAADTQLQPAEPADRRAPGGVPRNIQKIAIISP